MNSGELAAEEFTDAISFPGDSVEWIAEPKVVYGSDGYTLPEINGIGARLCKMTLAQALGDLVDGCAGPLSG